MAAAETTSDRTAQTRDRILDCAELLFDRYGFENTSMRQLTSAANVNLAAVNYHFGSKEALIRAVLSRRLQWLADDAGHRLDALQARYRDAAIPAAELLENLFAPVLEMARTPELGGHNFVRLISRSSSDPSEHIRTLLIEVLRPMLLRYVGALAHSLPGLSRAEITCRIHFMLGTVTFAMAGIYGLQAMDSNHPQGREHEAAIAAQLPPYLYAFMLGGLAAPPAQTAPPA